MPVYWHSEFLRNSRLSDLPAVNPVGGLCRPAAWRVDGASRATIRGGKAAIQAAAEAHATERLPINRAIWSAFSCELWTRSASTRFIWSRCFHAVGNRQQFSLTDPSSLGVTVNLTPSCSISSTNATISENNMPHPRQELLGSDSPGCDQHTTAVCSRVHRVATLTWQPTSCGSRRDPGRFAPSSKRPAPKLPDPAGWGLLRENAAPRAVDHVQHRTGITAEHLLSGEMPLLPAWRSGSVNSIRPRLRP